ncbi:MAG TPA: PQQ-binding-like beta-propeller repeat protein [Planctomycetaceae bacterium]|jgi:outer membrane protein assembly factor BamB|nr:PQQ-binding-like beta-propeller repeat protein [Planctomycetaceae bacterium]
MRRMLLLIFGLSTLGMAGCGWIGSRDSEAALPAPPRADSKAKSSMEPPGELVHSGSWTGWRGPGRDGLSKETGLLDSFPSEGPPIKWHVNGMGAGFSTVAIDAGRIFTLGSTKNDCQLLALNFANGRQLWSVSIGTGEPNSTPTVDGNRVYALSRNGSLACVDVARGKVIWKKEFTNDFGGSVPTWGYSESVLIDGDRVVCTPGSKQAMLVALNKQTGETVWTAPAPASLGAQGADGAGGYSSIVISNGAGVKQYVQLVGRGLVSFRASDGKFLWNYGKIANGTANIPTPLVRGDYVFGASGYGAGSALVELQKTDDGVTAKEVYFLNGGTLQNHHGGMVLYGDYIYCGRGHNSGFPVCLEFKTGKIKWDGGRGPGGGSAAVVEADGELIFRYEDGVVAMIEATPEKYKLKGRFSTATHNGTGWPHPVIVDKQLFLRDGDDLVCYDIARKASPKQAAMPEAKRNQASLATR